MSIVDIGALLTPYATRQVPEIEPRREAPEPAKPLLKYAPNRVVRKNERSRYRVHKAVPEGHRLAPRLSHWLQSVADSDGMAYLNKNRRKRLLWEARLLLALADTPTKTTTPGHKTLADTLGVSQRTVTDDIKWFHDNGLLATVAPGRSAEFVPKSAAHDARWPGASEQATNERAVYTFIEPLTNLTLEVMGSEPVDKTCDPTTLESGSNPTHARESERGQERQGSALTENPIEALYERGVVPSWRDRRVPDFPKHETTNAGSKRGRRAKQWHAALTLQRHNVYLRQLSTKHVAFLCRQWFEDPTYPWTWKDIHHALDNHPQSVRWKHDGATGMRSMAAYFTARMRPWAFGDQAMVPQRMRDWLRSEPARERAIAVARERAKAGIL